MRKMFEARNDLARERSIVRVLCEKWKCRAHKNPCPPYKIDWSFERSGEIMAMVEIKSSPKKYANYRLALHKYRDMVANSQLIKTIIAVALPDGIYFADIAKIKPIKYVWWEDSRQRDKTDSEPAAVFLWTDFSVIKDMIER